MHAIYFEYYNINEKNDKNRTKVHKAETEIRKENKLFTTHDPKRTLLQHYTFIDTVIFICKSNYKALHLACSIEFSENPLNLKMVLNAQINRNRYR